MVTSIYLDSNNSRSNVTALAIMLTTVVITSSSAQNLVS
jgi:hypothetical protein